MGVAEMELEDIEYVSLLPDELLEMELGHFLNNMEMLDQKIQRAYVRAQADGLVLQHVARISRDGSAHVGLEYLQPDDPLARVTPGENIYAINTLRYDDQPLLVRGPAVGPELTAGALQSDLFHLFQKLRSH
jgi:aspartokinase/homoserine dehydrogenase 2